VIHRKARLRFNARSGRIDHGRFQRLANDTGIQRRAPDRAKRGRLIDRCNTMLSGTHRAVSPRPEGEGVQKFVGRKVIVGFAVMKDESGQHVTDAGPLHPKLSPPLLRAADFADMVTEVSIIVESHLAVATESLDCLWLETPTAWYLAAQPSDGPNTCTLMRFIRVDRRAQVIDLHDIRSG
jgi:hypothetical protein